MPLQRRIPKEYQVVNVRDLARIDAGEITPEILYANGVIGKSNQPVKILGMGEIEGAYQVSAHRFSGTAREKIEGAGGTVTVLVGGSGDQEASAAEAAEEPVAEAAEESAPEAEETEEASAPEGEEASEAEDEKA
jgi:hypothetical protein